MGLLRDFKGDDNFWESNPQLLLNPILKEFYKEDKSKKKEQSSRIMYAISFYVDNSDDNKIYRPVPPEDRKKLIAAQYLEEPSFNWESYDKIIETLKHLTLTPAQISLFNFYKKLEERDKFINETEYSVTSYKAIEDMMKNTTSLYKIYYDIQKELMKEVNIVNKGDRRSSLTDNGTI